MLWTQFNKLDDFFFNWTTETKDLGFLTNQKLCVDNSGFEGGVRNLLKALRTKILWILSIPNLYAQGYARFKHDFESRVYKICVHPVVDGGTAVQKENKKPYKKNFVDLIRSVRNNLSRKLVMRCSDLGC